MHTKLRLSRLSLSLALLPLALAPFRPTQAQTTAPQAVTKPTLTVLHSFTMEDGTTPVQDLTVGADGALYGVATGGGTNNNGTVFKVTQGGLFHKLVDLYYKNGSSPNAPLLLLPDGSLMGSTFSGGKSDTGSLFLLTPPNRFQTKHEFASYGGNFQNTRGIYPQGPQVLAPDGAVYGVARLGGSGGSGLVYRWTTAHGLEVIHDFLNGKQGSSPFGLTLGSDGALYGITPLGGANNFGTVYRLTTDGIFTSLHTFSQTDGMYPSEPPVFGPDGALYGTTVVGGGPLMSGIEGTAYRLALDGAFSVLHAFVRAQEGSGSAILTLGPDGNFYSASQEGGPSDGGTVFRLSPTGAFHIIYAFKKGSSTGYSPHGGVTFEPNGVLYGSTTLGGLYDHGTVFKLRLP